MLTWAFCWLLSKTDEKTINENNIGVIITGIFDVLIVGSVIYALVEIFG